MTATTTAPTTTRDDVRLDAIQRIESYIADLTTFAESYNPDTLKRFVIETSPTLFLCVGDNGRVSVSGVLNATRFTKTDAVRIVRTAALRDGKGEPVAATIRNVNAATRESLQSARATFEMLRAL